ncbi:hypothetical protein B0H13DRAFT_2204066 [Mycena leptocephala]|nr:hypothetical protein B0H13DRAFT_2204066 [Mycena leptocephala]
MNASRCSRCGVVGNGPVEADGDPLIAPCPGTRHHTLLSTNEPPQDSEVPFLRSVISTAAARLTLLDEDIAKLRDRLEQLEQKRAMLSSFHTENNAILSTLRRMPPEVLSEIFLWTLPLARNAPHRVELRVTDAPWVLTHICRRWRSISILNPLLWSLVAISYQPDVNPASSYPLPMVETQITRAQTLKIHFYGCEASDSRPQIELFSALAKHSSRWEELSLGLTVALVHVLPTLRDCVPFLRRLWIEWESEDSQAGLESVDCFQVAPSLVDASVFNEDRFIPVSLPIHNLTRYHLNCPWRTHAGILELAKNLVVAYIAVSFDEEPWPPSSETIELGSLLRLFVSHAEVLDNLRTPHLEEIAVAFLPGEAPSLPTHLSSLIIRSLCPLRRLCLAGGPAPGPTAEILSKIPSIVDLGIIIPETQSDPVDAFILSLGGPGLAAGLWLLIYAASPSYAMTKPTSTLNSTCDG